MNDVATKLILLPRFTTFAGAGEFATPPLNVRVYRAALIDLGVAGALGSPAATVTVVVQESPDLAHWEDLTTLVVGDATEAGFGFEWMRLLITVAGSDPAVTCWSVGTFLHRHAAHAVGGAR